MKNKNNLEQYWQWRLGKVVWIFAMVAIWLGVFCEILDENIFDKKHNFYSEKIIVNGQIYHAKYSTPYDWQNIILVILQTFILTGALILATILMYKIILYIAFNEPLSCSCKKDKVAKLEEKNQNNKNNEENNSSGISEKQDTESAESETTK